jgi:hypothetical protein
MTLRSTREYASTASSMSSFAATGQSYGFGSKATGLDLIKPVGSFALSLNKPL